MISQDTRYKTLAMIATMLVGIVLANFLASYFFGNFWQSPAGGIQKGSLYSIEYLTAGFAFLLLTVFAMIICKVSRLKPVTAVYFFAFLPALLFLVLNWVFYLLFDRFAGSYGLQMLVYDGGRVFGIGSGMGGVYSNSLPLFVGAVLLALSIAYLVFKHNSIAIWGRHACVTVFFSVFALSVVFAVTESSVAEIPEEYGNDPGIKRITQTTTLELRSMSGPFSTLARDLSGLVFSRSGDYTAALKELNLAPIESSANTVMDGKKARQNIVFILVESMSPGVLAVNGGAETVMPRVNSLISQGLVFSNVWAQSSHSNYADIAALSGQYPLRSESIHFYPKNPSYPRSLPWEYLQQFGYSSAGFSSGDDNWGRMTNYLRSEHLEIFDHAGNEEKNKKRVQPTSTLAQGEDGRMFVDVSGFMMGGSRMYGTSRLDGITTNKALSWVDSKPVEQPLFVYINYQASHYPYSLLPENFERRHLTEESEIADKIRAGNTLGQPVQLIRQAYNDSLSYVDENIATVVEYMEKRDPENNVYVIAADTSTLMGEQIIGNGGKLEAEVLHIPLIIATPSIGSPVDVDLPMAQIDIMPTVYGLVGIAPDPASQGENVLSKQNKNRFIFSIAQSPAAHQYSVIYQDWQLVVDYDLQKMNVRYVGKSNGEKPPEFSVELKRQMASALDNWVDIQLGYYGAPGIHTKFYPPAYTEITAKASTLRTETSTATLED